MLERRCDFEAKETVNPSPGTTAALDDEVDSDAFVMGDDPDAKAIVGEAIESIPGMRWIDCGMLQMARIAETLTPLLISVNMRYKIHESGFRITGRDAWGDPRA